MSQTTEAVYVGVWINWSRGVIFGSTLTTNTKYGNLLIAFTALFISYVANRFWRIVCLTMHQYYSSEAPRDIVHHQHQVILRNSFNPETTLTSSLKLFRAYPKNVQRTLRLLPVILLAVLSLAAFTIASGFSSTISTSIADEVLLKGDKCGVLEGPETLDGTAASERFNAEKLSNAFNYAQQCYGTDEVGTRACDKFVVPQLPSQISNTSDCPFQSHMCRKTQNTLRMDTGHLDSNDHFGLNRPKDKRFAWRYVVSCAPIVTDGYTTIVNKSDGEWVRYHYGTDPVGSTDDQQFVDYIYEIKTSDQQYFNSTFVLSAANHLLYALHTKIYQNQVLLGEWTPIPELWRSDGNVLIAFLSGNGVHFSEQMDDDWYRATQLDTDIHWTAIPGNKQAYRPTLAASPLGCVEQWQWCKSGDSLECGPLSSEFDALYQAASLFNLTSEDLDPARPSVPSELGTRLIWPVVLTFEYPTFMGTLIEHFGSRALASQSRLHSGIQWALPDNQWQLDVIQWWYTILATVQAACKLANARALACLPLVDTVQGTNDPEFEKYLSPPLNKQEQKLCDSQKIRSSSYTSFSLFGLLFAYIVGIIIMIISFVLVPLLDFLYKNLDFRSYARLEWISNGDLQLHRLAHGELAPEEWSNCTKDVPTANPYITLASLDIHTDPRRPILERGQRGRVQHGMTREIRDDSLTKTGSHFEKGSSSNASL
ncbi:hypothetical protein GGR57DRAFT_502110 [Xylariaceae sp. FL1272]|nr:hypothetical protein GGR57DRAFT_502110 [Xylariaceae sp. FL1272]